MLWCFWVQWFESTYHTVTTKTTHSLLCIVCFMIRKLKQLWSTIPLISTNITTNPHLKSLNSKTPQHWCYSKYKPGDKSWMKKGPRSAYDMWNIFVVICVTDILWLISFGHCVVCPSSIYILWLSRCCLQTILTRLNIDYENT
jgi:hypothetical protein